MIAEYLALSEIWWLQLIWHCTKYEHLFLLSIKHVFLNVFLSFLDLCIRSGPNWSRPRH